MTPSSSFVSDPPTPTLTDKKEIVQALKSRSRGGAFWDDPWKTIPLSNTELNDLQDQIDADEVRYVFTSHYGIIS